MAPRGFEVFAEEKEKKRVTNPWKYFTRVRKKLGNWNRLRNGFGVEFVTDYAIKYHITNINETY